MIAYVLSAGAAITSLGIAMAISFSRLGRAVGVTVTLYVLVAAGWLALVDRWPLAEPRDRRPGNGQPVLLGRRDGFRGHESAA